MPRSYQAMGLELAPYVIDWGQIEEVKDVLLASNQMFCAEHTLKVSNWDNRFSSSNPASPFHGRNFQLCPATLSQDGQILYQGFIRSATLDHEARAALLVSQNVFTIPANYFVTLAATGNPAAIIRTILEQCGLQNYIDPVTFSGAMGGFDDAQATISVNYKTSGAIDTAQGLNGTTALSAIQSISSLCGLSCYVQGGLIRLSAYQPYQGDYSGVKWQITPEQIYSYQSLEFCYQNLSNSVNIGYGTSSNYYARNYASILANGSGFGILTTPKEVNTQFNGTSGNVLAVPNLLSAQYFATQFLARASNLRRQGSLVCGPELLAAKIGERCTVMAQNWGPAPIVCEIIETHTRLASKSVELVVATI